MFAWLAPSATVPARPGAAVDGMQAALANSTGTWERQEGAHEAPGGQGEEV